MARAHRAAQKKLARALANVDAPVAADNITGYLVYGIFLSPVFINQLPDLDVQHPLCAPALKPLPVFDYNLLFLFLNT